MDDEERHGGEKRTDQQPVPSHQSPLDEASPDRFLPQVGCDRPEHEEQQVHHRHLDPTAFHRLQTAGRGANGHSEQWKGDDHHQHRSDADSPAGQPREETTYLGSASGQCRQERGPAEQQDQLQNLGRHDVPAVQQEDRLSSQGQADGGDEQDGDRPSYGQAHEMTSGRTAPTMTKLGRVCVMIPIQVLWKRRAG
jgi:hypothetical protein